MTNTFQPPEVSEQCYPQGFRGAGLACGIKKSGKRDLALIVSDQPAVGAGVFTLNAFAAPPVEVSRRVLAKGRVQAIICNSGVANACTGAQGLRNAEAMAAATAQALKLQPSEVAVCSTGVIGKHLPVDIISKGILEISGQLQPDAWADVVDAMRTTDAFPKMSGARFTLNSREIRLLGLAKGGGMIHPNMATMLCFLMTDCAVELETLRTALRAAVSESFNSITVDGDTSTNDTVLLLANGVAGNLPVRLDTPDYETFVRELTKVCVTLGKLICHDGEGATKVAVITVRGARDNNDARKAAQAVGRSQLVKTALYGSDANWGRIVCAVGYSGAAVDPARCAVTLAGQRIFHDGIPVEIDEARAKADLEKQEVPIEIDLGLGGPGEARVYASDLTHDYIQLNSFYRT